MEKTELMVINAQKLNYKARCLTGCQDEKKKHSRLRLWWLNRLIASAIKIAHKDKDKERR